MTNLPSAGPPADSAALTGPDGLDDLAAMIAEQLAACHAAAASWFEMANDHEDLDLPARIDALKLATRLVQASASAARAVKQIKGGEFHHHVTVSRIDYAAEKAARKARAKGLTPEEREKEEREFDRKLKRACEVEFEKLTPEERTTVADIWARADARTGSGPSMINEFARGSEWWKKPFWAARCAEPEDEPTGESEMEDAATE